LFSVCETVDPGAIHVSKYVGNSEHRFCLRSKTSNVELVVTKEFILPLTNTYLPT
jgi:hypothetical protein